MQKFFRSGAAFLVVAMLCLVAGLLVAGFTSKSGTASMSLGLFWLIMAIIVRGKYAKKASPVDKP